jgi:hypothetical protein
MGIVHIVNQFTDRYVIIPQLSENATLGAVRGQQLAVSLTLFNPNFIKLTYPDRILLNRQKEHCLQFYDAVVPKR